MRELVVKDLARLIKDQDDNTHSDNLDDNNMFENDDIVGASFDVIEDRNAEILGDL